MMKLDKAMKDISKVLEQHPNVKINPNRSAMIKSAVKDKEALISEGGALVTWTPPESTGRSPKDTYIVRHPETEDTIDWDSPSNIPMDPDTFDMLLEDAQKTLFRKSKLYITDRVVGAETRLALPVRTVTDQALTVLFTDNMFRKTPNDIEESAFSDRQFVLLVLPFDKLDTEKYAGRLRKLPDGTPSRMAVAMDFDRMLGVVYGSGWGWCMVPHTAAASRK
jgi:phosphoenolpyruvate carboxykinase (ATP)